MTLRIHIGVVLTFAAAFVLLLLLNLWQWHGASTRSANSKVVAMQLEKAATELAGTLDARIVVKTRTIERTRDVIVSEAQADPDLQDPVNPALDAALRSANERMRSTSDTND